MQIIREINTKKTINNKQQLKKYLKEFENEDREYFIVIGVNTKLQPLYREIVSIGGLNSTQIHPREVFKKAIIMSCSGIFVAHNHPSGDPTPSTEDKEITKQLIKAGEILGIDVYDHIIITKKKHLAIKEEQ